MGAERRIATVVAFGFVVIATIVLVYMFNEDNRREDEAVAQVDTSIHRAAENFAQYCVPCHGSDGRAGPDYPAIPVNTEQNQTTDPVAGPEREAIIRQAIERGRNLMPAWLNTEGGSLSQQQIDDLVLLIRNGGFDETVAADIEHNLEAHGVAATSTAPPLPTPPSLEEGGKAVFQQRCVGCHKSNDFPDGGDIGPDLTGLASLSQTPVYGEPVSEAFLTNWETNPLAVQPQTTMPNLNLSEGEVELVVQYLLTLE